MSSWKETTIGEFVDFNPAEKLKKGEVAKKIPMAMLTEFHRKIKGFERAAYQAGPKFRNGDTLVAKITPCLENGKTAQVDILDNNEVAFGSSEFIVLRENQHSINDYILYLAQSPVFRERAIGCMEGTSGRKRVNEGALKRQKIQVPDKNTQRKIATVLSTLDDKIELNNKINAELEAMAKTLYDYWFVQFDFPNEKGKPYKSSGGKMVWNEELKREIPKGWEVKKLGKYANIKKGTLITEKSADTFGTIKVISAGLDFSYFHSQSNYPENTITISASGANAGFINFWREPIYACDCTTVRGISIADTLQIFEFLRMRQQYIYQQARGSAQPHVYPKDIENLLIPIPPADLIDLFGTVVVPLNTKVTVNMKQNNELSTLRDWLLPMLMNGQVTVGKAYEKMEEVLSMAAEGEPTYKKA